ncbi:MAG: hypothetical protein P8129_17235 [Anaerolineae bacterium]|jgi:hypothetical protein
MHTLDDYPSLKRGLGLVLLVAGMALSAFLLFALGKDLSLWIFGRPVSAQVVDSWAKATNSGEQEELAFRYYVRYRFATPEGKVVVSTKTVSAQEWVGVGHGSQGQGGVDFYTGEAEGPSAPVYQEQEHLSEFAEGGMATAAQVNVIYFPLYPAHNRLAEGRFVPLLACTYVPLLAMAGLALLGARQFLHTDPAEDRWQIREVAPVRAEN